MLGLQVSARCASVEYYTGARLIPSTSAHTHTHTVLTATLTGEPGLASYPVNSLSPCIPELRIFLGQAKLSMAFLTQSHQIFLGVLFVNSFNLPHNTTIDAVIIIFSFNVSKPSQSTICLKITQKDLYVKTK